MANMDLDRLHELRDGPDCDGPVLYWMSRDQRAADNWALLYAQQEAIRRNVSLGVVFCLVPSFLRATDLHYGFMLQGLAETSAQLASKGIPFFMLQGDLCEELPRFAARSKASLLVTDMDPLRIKVDWQHRVARAVKCRVVEVDAHNVVPCRFVSQKEEFAARTIRPKIHRLLPRFLVPMPRLRKHPHPWAVRNVSAPVAGALLEQTGMLPYAGATLPMPAGPRAARACLRRFVSGPLDVYDTARNDPNAAGQSDLSPYLHFGQISAQRVALTVDGADAYDAGRAAFLEELIVRRELSDNFCLHNPNYDSTKGFANWARLSLSEHAEDTRDYLYSSEQFEAAETHDALWNAAQLEMVRGGKMHGYMRMYWGKKILEWTRSPEEAMEIALRLNNTYELDGRDPNGYAGVAWCIGGVHDRAWPRHNVYGKVRYMNANGCRRKFDVAAYIRRVDAMQG